MSGSEKDRERGFSSSYNCTIRDLEFTSKPTTKLSGELGLCRLYTR
ncbi:hypothetical protein O53_1515 [Microcystis aeruginosa TAIHU98]|uniref:Uncharacterized protein n=1 Tax=Microcystis aeruginosa TAIHU98 TaxID=1134457 RepID=L7ED03_MICAE|nr:hypothetical protein O53_1515 [Microcystis aeruginosa TAIHU98]ODV38860.1 hypothetical protein BFG60_1778 [Microcystis aeruginosa NIES-98]